MSYVLFRISKLKSLKDFKLAITEVNEGYWAYEKCIKFIKQQQYYSDHEIRKNGILALWLKFELHYESGEKVDSEKWNELNHSWISLNFPCKDDGAWRDMMKEHPTKHYYSYDFIFTSVSPDNGKINFAEIFGKNEKVWFADKQRSYDKCMRSSLNTKPAPKYINYQFLHSNNSEDLNMPDGFPLPTEGESANEYCKRVRAYHDDKIQSISDKQSRISDLKKENSELRKQHKVDMKKLDRYQYLSDLEQRYGDFRTLRKYVTNGEYVVVALDSCEKDGQEDNCAYIKSLLDYGKSIANNENNN